MRSTDEDDTRSRFFSPRSRLSRRGGRCRVRDRSFVPVLAGQAGAYGATEAAAGRRYDVVVAADVLVYLRDPARVAAAVRHVLAPGGLFAFTVETHAGEGVLLGESLRYAHSAACVRSAMAGLELVQLKEVATRTERRAPVPGLLGIALAC